MKTQFYITFVLIALFSLGIGLLFASDQDVLKKEEPLGREKFLVVNIDYGNGYIYFNKAKTSHVFEGEFVYDKHRPDVRYEVVGNEGRLNVHFSGKLSKDSEDEESRNIMSLKKIYDNELHLNFSPEIPIDMDLELGVVKGDMDLGGLKLRKLNLEVGVSQGSILFGEKNSETLESCSIQGGVGKLAIEELGNANLENFSFEGGVGSYIIDFGGDYRRDVKANIELGMGKLKLYLPSYIGTRIKVEKSFLSSVSIDKYYKENDFYYNDLWGKTSHNLDVKLETGVGKVDVEWIEK
jgi:hypothetical protein